MSYITRTLSDAFAKDKRIFVIGLLLLAIAGAGILLFCTPWGIGLTPDSAMYIGSARGFLAGHGFTMLVIGDRYNSVTDYMPAFPAAIALLSKFGPSPLQATRFAQAIFFAANIALAGIVIYLATHGSTVAALVGAVLTLLAPDILWVHSFAWSEALFLLFVIAAAAMTARSIERPTIWRLLATGALLGASYLTRYMGVAFIAAAGLSILLVGPVSWRKRLLNAAIMGAAASVVVIAWMIRNRRLGNATVGRPMVWHPVTVKHLIEGIKSLEGWIAPTSGSALIVSTCLALAAAISGAIFASREKNISRTPLRSVLPQVVGIFTVVYLFFILVGISLFDYTTVINARILSPVLGCAIVALCILGASASGGMRVIATAACAAMMVQWTIAAAVFLAQLRHDGLGYASPKWLQSQTLRAVHRLPRGTLIYSNAWDVIALLDDRPNQTLPGRIVGVSGQTNANFDRDMQAIADEVRSHGAVIVMFHNMRSRPTLPSESDLRALMPLRTLSRRDDGVIYATTQP